MLLVPDLIQKFLLFTLIGIGCFYFLASRHKISSSNRTNEEFEECLTNQIIGVMVMVVVVVAITIWIPF